MIPLFRFTLTWNPLDGSSPANYVIPYQEEPAGWKETKLILERDKDYHSVIEYFEAPIRFYGTGLGFILAKEEIDGIRTNITVLAEIQHDREIGFETLFLGKLDIPSIEDRKKANYKFVAKIPIIRNDLWSRFIAKKDTSVNVMSDKDIYGNDVTPLTPKTLNLISQKVQKKYLGYQTRDITRTFTIPDGEYVVLDFTDERNSEITTRFLLGIGESSDLPAWKFDVEYGGDYDVFSEMRFYQGSFIGSTQLDNAIKVKIQINDDAPVNFTKTDTTVGIDSWSIYSYIATHSLNARDRIRVYMKNETGAPQTVNWFANVIQESYLRITADTIFPANTSDALLIHDLGYSIIDRITTPGSFYSPFFGHTSYTAVEYDEIGCGFPYMTLLGLHARGFNFDSKILSKSWSTWFDSTNAIFNIGVGYKTIDSIERIYVDKKENFYDNSDRSITLLNVPDIVRTYDNTSVVTNVKVGYKTWEAESGGMLDDPQASSSYTTVHESSGQPLALESEFIAAGLALETTRRQSVEPTKDWKLDNNLFIVAIDKDSGPSSFDPELSDNFTGINLKNPDFRYNIRLWPVYNLLRWLNVVIMGLTKYPTSLIKFTGGEGNYDAYAQMDPASDCLMSVAEIISCKQDIAANQATQRNKPLHGIEMYSFRIPMSWSMYKAIREKSDKAIGIGVGTTTGGTFDYTFDETFTDSEVTVEDYFIKKITWSIYNASAEVELWKDVPALT
jgi:hypothetical protein